MEDEYLEEEEKTNSRVPESEDCKLSVSISQDPPGAGEVSHGLQCTADTQIKICFSFQQWGS